jgi:hypothetical protein
VPALPLDEAGKYVAAAYLVYPPLILVYVANLAAKPTRIVRELTALAEPAARREAEPAPDTEREPV